MGNPGAHVKPGSIAAKRRGARISSIKKKHESGTAHGDERALIRLGASNTKILAGAEDLSEWSMEELQAGRRLDKNGGHRGKDPVVIPKAIHDELTKRTLSNAQQMLRDNLENAVSTLTMIASDESVEPKDRLRAVNMILERVMGKTPEKVEFSGEAPWMIALQKGIVVVNNGSDNGESDETDPEEDEDE